MKDLIKTQFAEADRTLITDLLAQLEAALAGKLVALSGEERQRLGSVNEQNKLLVDKVRDFRESAPALSSPDVDWEEFESDYVSRDFLESLATRLESIASQTESTKILHDYDNYQDALDDYAYARYKAGAGTPGAEEKVREIKQFFTRSKQAVEGA